MNQSTIPFGGWLVNAAERLAKENNMELLIAFPKNNSNAVEVLKGEKIKYFSFPTINSNNTEMLEDNPYLLTIIEQSKPDIVHIFGTELPHSLAMINICKIKKIKAVASIQGLISFIAKHYTMGIPKKVLKSYTLRDLIKQDNIKQQQQNFENRGKYEVEALQKVTHIIGRTQWDRACTSIIHQEAQYYYCNETLRSVFYQHQWELNKCEKHSIFLSQGSYPVKGLHFMLEAMCFVMKRYPKTKLYIGGNDITKTNTWKEKLKLSSYGKYIKQLIKKNKLENNIVFTGVLNEEKMCDRFLKSHVFVSSSTIENSPNSLGEAMILGVPSVSSNVGGVADFVKHNEDGFLYQADAAYMLAYYICEIFKDDELALFFSKHAKIKAANLFNVESNHSNLLGIYHKIKNSVITS